MEKLVRIFDPHLKSDADLVILESRHFFPCWKNIFQISSL
jgi:hypothetical protein